MRSAIEMALVVLALVMLLGVFLAFRDSPLLYDEVFHYERIAALLKGEYPQVGWGAMFPGYHVFMAGMLRLAGASSIPAARLMTFVISLLSCVAAYCVARAIDRPSSLLRTLQFVTLPILLPFFPLLYTDALSLALLLFALAAVLRRRVLLSGLCFTLAVGVRQNNVLWAPLLLTIALEGDAAWKVAAASIHLQLREVVGRLRYPAALRSLLRIGWPFLVPIVCFGLFVALMGRASFSPTLAAAHPFPSFSFGNIFFALFLSAGLFLPILFARARRVFSLLKDPWVLSLLVALFFLFCVGFHVDHPANSEAGRLRDALLLAAAAGGLPGLLFWLICALGVLVLLAQPLARRSFLWIYPLSILYLGGSWLIDVRYAIVPLTLFLLLRKAGPWRMDILQCLFNALLLLWVFS